MTTMVRVDDVGDGRAVTSKSRRVRTGGRRKGGWRARTETLRARRARIGGSDQRGRNQMSRRVRSTRRFAGRIRIRERSGTRRGTRIKVSRTRLTASRRGIRRESGSKDLLSERERLGGVFDTGQKAVGSR